MQKRRTICRSYSSSGASIVKAIGKYKDRDVRITNMYIDETYGDYLCLSDDVLERENREILTEHVKKTVERLWGDGRPVYVMDLERIDYKKKFPRIMVYVWLVGETIGDACGSHLILVWLQDSAEGFYEQAGANLKEIVWQEKAKDFDY